MSAIEQLIAIRRAEPADGIETVDIFTHTSPLKCPPWARGAYGGHTLAMALSAAYATVPSGHRAHSIQYDFIHAARPGSQLLYVVHRTRDSRSFASRMVHVRQLDKTVLTATASFMAVETLRKRAVLQHSTPFPAAEQLATPPPDNVSKTFNTQSAAGQGGVGEPCDCVRAVPNQRSGRIPQIPSERKFYQWIRARGRINGGMQQHLAALAYMTDNYFIGTVFRAHMAARFSGRQSSNSGSDTEHQDATVYYNALAEEELRERQLSSDSPEDAAQVDWLVTLNHSIHFHEVENIRADEWMLAEMESPWAGSERGFVLQRIWSASGVLLATCFQEGVVRLRSQPSGGKL